jgi:pilus assembly protein CpaC
MAAPAEPETLPLALPEPATGTGSEIDVDLGHSYIFLGGRPINRVLVSDDSVAQVKLLEEGQFQVRGTQLGSTDIWVWFRDQPTVPVRYGVHVNRDVRALERSVGALVGPGAVPPRVYSAQDRIVLDGSVADLETLERTAEMARVYDADFVNLMTVGGDHQVQLEVVFAEVSRSRLRELGVNLWFDSGSLLNGVQIGASGVGPPGVSQAFTLLGTLAAGFDLMASLDVLEQHNLSRVLARPTLVALSGQKAEFLAGGEVPIPVAQFGDRISVEFREYGVKVTFVPTVLASDVIDTQVFVEVSDLDTANTIRMTDITIPSLVSRKSSSHLRLPSGTTFAMAGMLDERITSTRAKVPLLGDIPLIGALFRRVEHRRIETELIIFVTPRLVRPLTAGEVPPLPAHETNNDPGDFEFFLLGLDHQPRKKARDEKPAGPVGMER